MRDVGGMTTIFIGFFISGIGSSFFHSFGIPYMDDNMSKNKSPGERVLSDFISQPWPQCT